jgi:ArsR family transcriptional regulator
MSIQRCCPEASVYPRPVDDEAAVFKALGDPTRLGIVATIARAGHEVCVCDFVDGFGLNQSTISHHLRILKDAGVVTSVRRGTWGYYSLAPGLRDRLEAAIGVAVPQGVYA